MRGTVQESFGESFQGVCITQMAGEAQAQQHHSETIPQLYPHLLVLHRCFRVPARVVWYAVFSGTTAAGSRTNVP